MMPQEIRQPRTGAGVFQRALHHPQGIVEGLNRKINLVTRKAYGFRSYEVLKIALFHTMGGLPEPEFTHRFC